MAKTQRFIPVVILLAIAVGLTGYGLIKRDEAAGSSVEYRMCDLTLRAPAPPEVIAAQSKKPLPTNTILVGQGFTQSAGGELIPAMGLRMHREPKEIDPATGNTVPGRNFVNIDPKSGQVVEEHFTSPANEASMRATLATVRVKPLDPSSAPWPYTDERQFPQEAVEQEVFKYMPADPGAGVVAWVRRGSSSEGIHQTLIVANCRSVMKVDYLKSNAGLRVELKEFKVHQDDQAAFQRFLDTVEPPPDSAP